MLSGYLKSLLHFWRDLAKNHRYQLYYTPRDFEEVWKRVDNEGISFLTVALPSYGKALDSFFSTGVWVPPIAFKAKDGYLPLFLGKAIKAALEGNSLAVDYIRQVTYVFYKLEVPTTKEKIADFLNQFVKTDRELSDPESFPAALNLHTTSKPGVVFTVPRELIIREMRDIVARVLCNLDPFNIIPSHSGGVTSCRTPNEEKYHRFRFIPKLDVTYPYSEHFFLSSTHLVDEMEKLSDSSVVDPKARVCLVPKDSRGPRVISCEPAEYMYIQQGIMRLLYGHLECHDLTSGQINFTDQTTNRILAQQASINGLYATMDLKDASDRVSLSLIRDVFPSNWVEALESCRSEVTVLPDGREIVLNKFAPMGSSCCFPVEALAFWACAQASLRLHRFISRRGAILNPKTWVQDIFSSRTKVSLGKDMDDVYVYGDDIICRSQDFPTIADGLETVGLLVNRQKSFVTGPFRESCGGDYHNGMDVTPIRIKKWFSYVGTGLQASADFINLLINKFGYDSALPLIRLIELEVGYIFPRTSLDIPMSIRVPFSASNDVFFKRRFNRHLQRYEHRVLFSRPKIIDGRGSSWPELLRKLLEKGTVSSGTRLQHSNPLKPISSTLLPGQYAVTHTAQKNWVWAWLG
jgi:hypothetical protein